MIKGIALGDCHIPNHEPRLLTNIMRYMKDEKFDELVIGGDFMDMSSISHHAMERGDNRALEGKRLSQEYAQAKKILDEISFGIKDKYFLMGNHEEWIDKFIDKYPMLEGLLEVDKLLGLKDKNYKIIPYRHAAILGKLYFVHGDTFGRYCPAFHSRSMVTLYNKNVVYFDRHQAQSYIKPSPVGLKEKHGGFCIPCIAKTNPKWAKDRPNNWVNGFAVWYRNGSKFSVFTIISVDGTFIAPNGKEYK